MTEFKYVKYKCKARFVPKKTDTLREGMMEHVGKVFTFDRAFTLDEDEGPYAGQQTWTFAREHDAELGKENAGRWVPEEDLEFLEDGS